MSLAEQRWIEQHPNVKVAINENMMPISFIDSEGKYRGISIDVLGKISLRTGLKFDLQPASSIAEMLDQIKTGQIDVVAGVSPSIEREADLRFTRPFLTSPNVLVTHLGPDSPRTLDDMAGKRLAVTQGNSAGEFVRQHFAQVELVNAPLTADGLEMVAQGKTDGAINSLISARIMISRQYRDVTINNCAG